MILILVGVLVLYVVISTKDDNHVKDQNSYNNRKIDFDRDNRLVNTDSNDAWRDKDYDDMTWRQKRIIDDEIDAEDWAAEEARKEFDRNDEFDFFNGN